MCLWSHKCTISKAHNSITQPKLSSHKHTGSFCHANGPSASSFHHSCQHQNIQEKVWSSEDHIPSAGTWQILRHSTVSFQPLYSCGKRFNCVWDINFKVSVRSSLLQQCALKISMLTTNAHYEHAESHLKSVQQDIVKGTVCTDIQPLQKSAWCEADIS